ncbi:MAG: ATP-dependent Clp protease ATP-binding subunit ClpA [Bacteroidales bacterium]|nr:ATP-dependent Clp protease ATP-binding subunit ClpA [Bacteroidales bacterium]
MAEIKQTERASRILNDAFECCKSYRHEFLMPLHLLSALIEDDNFKAALNIFFSPQVLAERVEEFLVLVDAVPEGIEYEPMVSVQMGEVIESAIQVVASSGVESIDIPHLVAGILKLEESWAAYLLKDCLNDKESDFMSQLIDFCDFDDKFQDEQEENKGESVWRKLVTCMNEHYKGYNPLIGRELELKRTIQVLCRRDKNNPLHVGEPGVGKSALVWGLVRLIEENKVPKRLKGSKIYQLDMGTLLAGTQYRGDFENRIKQIMDGIQEESENNIVYIDEIHTLVGAGAIGEGSMDASNMLKPYLESGKIRFIGSTTYEEYNRHFSRSKGLVRRFQQIDILEPSVDETKNIIMQLKPRYEEFHDVKYTDEAVSFAVEASAKHINDRFLPDKAIDLIDEAGAAMEIDDAVKIVGKKEIADVLSKTCKVDALSEAQDEDYQQLESLADRMLSQIYGQDEAIRQVVESVQMSRAGLLDDNKPLASLLFVGPTGVGKTEVARVLSKELGIALKRFDMSEYIEKHAVAKLIGSPAGYVGYEDGGLLTDAIRKNPNCVLLLDEIEKAHQDIYNILLQVMDYARLTDNKGRHADFRNVVLIMTSNAGAQYASQASIGFDSNVSRGDAMMKQVKKTFKPEFLNRLSGTVVFHDMDKQMAIRILQKKLRELDSKLQTKQVNMTLSPEAFEYILKEGFTPEYGARELDRVISQKLKPLLMREILFGSLKKGGNITIDIKDGSLSVR